MHSRALSLLTLLTVVDSVLCQRLGILERGIDVRSGYQSTNTSSYGSPEGFNALDAGMNMGGNYIRLQQTFFVRNQADSSIQRLPCDTIGRRVTAMCSESDANVAQAIQHAVSRHRGVVLSVQVEPDWENPGNQWQPEGPGDW